MFTVMFPDHGCSAVEAGPGTRTLFTYKLRPSSLNSYTVTKSKRGGIVPTCITSWLWGILGGTGRGRQRDGRDFTGLQLTVCNVYCSTAIENRIETRDIILLCCIYPFCHTLRGLVYLCRFLKPLIYRLLLFWKVHSEQVSKPVPK